MTTDTSSPRVDDRRRKVISSQAASAPIYGLGFIGALVYYIQHATTVWIGLWGFFKAIFWPATLIYELFEFLNM